MKIGILTFHCAHNYGAVLQVYATQEQLKSMGHEVEVIDYRPNYLLYPYTYEITIKNLFENPLKTVLQWLKMKMISVYHRCCAVERRKGFDQFVTTKLNLSHRTFFEPFVENYDYDCFVIGSDQVWNSMITKKMDPVFWGDFRIRKDAKIITYAASMPLYSLSEIEKKQLENKMSNFYAISVREQELKYFLMKNICVSAKVVLDPTLLVQNFVWKKIAVSPKINRRYVLHYTLGGLGKTSINLAKKIAHQIDGVVVTISLKKGVKGDVYYVVPTPEEFVGWFEFADFVVTSSFHGTSFALLYQKPFYSIIRGIDKDSRQRSLLSDLGLSERLISVGELPDYNKIDYTPVLLKWSILQRISVDFIKTNL